MIDAGNLVQELYFMISHKMVIVSRIWFAIQASILFFLPFSLRSGFSLSFVFFYSQLFYMLCVSQTTYFIQV